VQTSDVIILDTPQDDLIEISSSSYGLSLFSLKAGSHLDKCTEAAPGESSSVSVWELWPGIDLLDEPGLEGTSAVLTQGPWWDQVSRSHTDPQGSWRMDKGSSCVDRGAPGSSSVPQHGCGGSSAKNKATQILVDASRTIAPQMKHLFVDRQYSPSTGMDRSEWEIILEELIRMGFLVKQEPVSEGEDNFMFACCVEFDTWTLYSRDVVLSIAFILFAM
jgi:hypothetical protein